MKGVHTMKKLASFRLDESTMSRIQKLAERENRSATDIIRQAINVYATISNMEWSGHTENEIKGAAYIAYLAQ